MTSQRITNKGQRFAALISRLASMWLGVIWDPKEQFTRITKVNPERDVGVLVQSFIQFQSNLTSCHNIIFIIIYLYYISFLYHNDTVMLKVRGQQVIWIILQYLSVSHGDINLLIEDAPASINNSISLVIFRLRCIYEMSFQWNACIVH